MTLMLILVHGMGLDPKQELAMVRSQFNVRTSMIGQTLTQRFYRLRGQHWLPAIRPVLDRLL